jgi:mycothiol synthase
VSREYRFRAPTAGDLAAVVELVARVTLEDYGEPEDDEENTRIVFSMLDLQRDAWVVEAPSGELVAGGIVRVRHPTRLRSMAAVLPEHRGRGVGSALLGRIEQRARELAVQHADGEEVWLGQDVAPGNAAARELLERHGFECVRHFWKMVIDLDGETPKPEWPAGIRLDPFNVSQTREAYEASEDAFQDHWGHVPHDYGEWRAWSVERETFDPTLWLIARDGEEIAGFSYNYVAPSEGWVGVLGVRRPWRRRGLGRALLLESFRLFKERGLGRVALGVDSANPTGATRLYEGAGMRVLFQSDVYRKILEPAKI